MEVYGYGYVNSKKTVISRSTIYQTLRGRFIPTENIIMEIIENGSREKPRLVKLLDKMLPEDVLVIANKRTLGETPDFRKWWKEIVLNRNLNLLIIDDMSENGTDEYSSTDFSFIRKSDSEIERIRKKLETAKFEKVTKELGRKNARVSFLFIESYWAFQCFKVTPEEAYQHAGVSKPTFYKLCREYEQSSEYYEEFKKYASILENLPKRGGLNKEQTYLLMKVEQQKIPLDQACEEIGLKISSEDYRRYVLAHEVGRRTQKYEKDNYDPNYFQKLKR